LVTHASTEEDCFTSITKRRKSVSPDVFSIGQPGRRRNTGRKRKGTKKLGGRKMPEIGREGGGQKRGAIRRKGEGGKWGKNVD